MSSATPECRKSICSLRSPAGRRSRSARCCPASTALSPPPWTRRRDRSAGTIRGRSRRCRIEIPRYVASGSAVFSGVPDSQLLNYGVPAEWLDDVRQAADEDAILTLRIIFPPRRPRRCWNWLPGAHRSGCSPDPRTEIRLPILMRSAGSESCPTRRSCAGRSNIRGRSGRYFCTRLNGRSWNGRASARSEDSPARTAAGAPLVGLLQGGRRSRRARAPDRTAPDRSPGAPTREVEAPAVRVLRGGRGAGHRRGRVALSGCPRRRTPVRPVLRRRPRSKDLPDAILLASLGGRHPRPLAHLAGQLPHLPSDPAAGGPAAG